MRWAIGHFVVGAALFSAHCSAVPGDEVRDAEASADTAGEVGSACSVISPPLSTGGGPPNHFNSCFGVCRDDADCGGALCRRNDLGVSVCAMPACASDADCTAEPCGRCVPKVRQYHLLQVLLDYTASSCIYLGGCRPGSCSGCVAAFEHIPYRPNGPSTVFHACPGDGG